MKRRDKPPNVGRSRKQKEAIDFNDGHVATQKELEATKFHLTGNWRVVRSRRALSKAISWYLRIGVAQRQEHNRSDGFVDINQIIAFANENKSRANPTVDLPALINEAIVNDKKRFDMWVTPNGAIRWMRAVQGHLQPVVVDEAEFNYQETTIDDVQREKLRLWRGTLGENLFSIQKRDIAPGGLTGLRQHVHLSNHPPGSELHQCGCRFDAPNVIEVDAMCILFLGITIRKSTSGAYFVADTIPTIAHIRYVQLDTRTVLMRQPEITRAKDERGRYAVDTNFPRGRMQISSNA